MQKSTIMWSVLGIAGIFLFLVGAYYLTSQPEQAVVVEELKTTAANDHTKWAQDGRVTIIEYSDFQCPACALYEQMIADIEADPEAKDIRDNTTFAYRHFPLDTIHKNARAASYAAEAAARQNAFFPMHDLLFAGQTAWSEAQDPFPIFASYAEELKLDGEQFKTDFNAKDVRDRVQDDYVSGMQFGVRATPTFYINGRAIQNPRSADDFKQTIRDMLKESTSQP